MKISAQDKDLGRRRVNFDGWWDSNLEDWVKGHKFLVEN